MDAETYGRGLAFAVALSAQGRVAFSSGLDNITECLRVILATEPGERVMLPAFGAGLRQFLFEPNTAATHRLIEERVRRAVQRWEPRVRVESVDVGADRADPGAAVAHLRYRLVATGAPADLVVSVPVQAQVPVRSRSV